MGKMIHLAGKVSIIYKITFKKCMPQSKKFIKFSIKLLKPIVDQTKIGSIIKSLKFRNLKVTFTAISTKK